MVTMKFKHFELVQEKNNIFLVKEDKTKFLIDGDLLNQKYEADDIAVIFVKKAKVRLLIMNKTDIINTVLIKNEDCEIIKDNNKIIITNDNVLFVVNLINKRKVKKELSNKVQYVEGKFLIDNGLTKIWLYYDEEKNAILIDRKEKFINLLHLYYVYLFHNDKYKIKRQVIDLAIKSGHLFPKYNDLVEQDFGKNFIKTPNINWDVILNTDKRNIIVLFKKALRMNNIEFYEFIKQMDIDIPKVSTITFIANNEIIYNKVVKKLIDYFNKKYKKYIDNKNNICYDNNKE